MNTLATIGTIDETISYTDRPTVKVIIKKGDLVLLLNNGLLPGGGVDGTESDLDAIARELQEELAVTVGEVQALGTVIQYRNFLGKKYVIRGYEAKLISTSGTTNPQDAGEAQFTKTWLTLGEALELVSESIQAAKAKPIDTDLNQGKLYNLMTSYELLKRLR